MTRIMLTAGLDKMEMLKKDASITTYLTLCHRSCLLLDQLLVGQKLLSKEEVLLLVPIQTTNPDVVSDLHQTTLSSMLRSCLTTG
jgi:hypothetical protein